MATNRLGKDQQEHDNLIRMMAVHFRNLGYSDIRADLEDYEPKPNTIYGQKTDHTPDLTCKKNDDDKTFIILESETCDSIFDDHTASQWTLFRSAANNRGGEFHIVIPRLCDYDSGRKKAQERLDKLGIKADEIWTPKE